MKSHFKRIKMDVRVVFFSLMLFGVFHVARLRSIDQIIEDVETDFERKLDPSQKLPTKAFTSLHSFHGNPWHVSSVPCHTCFQGADLPEPRSRFQSRVWYDYEVKGRTEDLVKLQLDMIITKDLWDTVIDTEDALPSRAKRNAVDDKTRLWPRRIPYILNDEFDINDKFKLVMAMDHWEEHTCLEFVEADETKDFDIIEFVPIPYGCESLLGRMQGRQPINLAPPCMYKQVIVHEIGHALGLYHEHMRADRDEYVTVNYENINVTLHPQFDKLKAFHYDGYNKPYDYESIMHYGKLFYSLNRRANLITIEPKNEAYLDVIGEALSLSFYDVRIVNEMYECSAGCEPKVCPGNGFLGKNCECYCTGKDAYEIILCDRTENCGKPNISLSQYFVYTNNFANFISSWEEEAVVYPHGTHFIMGHINESCGYRTATLNCSHGQWEGEVLPCEKACLVGNFSRDYIVKSGNKIVQPGDGVLSARGVFVSCRYTRKDTVNPGEYIECSDGIWLRNISDIICIKEHPLCPVIVNSQLTGSFDDGFSVTCSEGYEMEAEGESVNSFRCTWEGEWEPLTPVCNPANCTIPRSKNSVGKLYSSNGDEVLRGSEITHGRDVTLHCPKGHLPEPVTMYCQHGKWNTPDRKVPECVFVTCPKPIVVNAKYLPQKDVYMYGDYVGVGHCKGILALEGSRELKCQQFGNWSDTAVCKPFCDDGVLKFESMKNKEFRDGVWHRKYRISSYVACEKKCRRYKRFLCLSFVYGVKNGRRFCHIHPQNPAEMPERVQARTFYTIVVRQCVRN